MHYQIKSVSLIFIAFGLSNVSNAFELATEGTMSSVVITAAKSAEELKKAASTPEGYLDPRYELMPFKTEASISIDDVDEVSKELEYAQLLEVNKTQEDDRIQAESGMLADAIRGYLPPVATDAIKVVATEVLEGFATIENVGVQVAEVVFGQMEQTFKLVSATVDSISHETTRYWESLSMNNVGFGPEQESLGSFHISDMTTTTKMTITAHE